MTAYCSIYTNFCLNGFAGFLALCRSSVRCLIEYIPKILLIYTMRVGPEPVPFPSNLVIQGYYQDSIVVT